MKDNKNTISGLVREIKGKGRKKSFVLQLAGSATIGNAVAIKDMLNQAAQKNKPCTIDLSEISECDISLIQLLIGIAKSDRNELISIFQLVPRNPVSISARLAGLRQCTDKKSGDSNFLGIRLINKES